ncbi:UPF0225 protein [Porphyridium purpureum]|uniref:UPF0225 protein n=1 Tax=Porphyridium purpureum TaxID=35688 RepID=A0A5J4Z4H4_PORPP|nr:UPF0225 protein [Porphyridium purpureum]|eukprot:POR6422..scf295_1
MVPLFVSVFGARASTWLLLPPQVRLRRRLYANEITLRRANAVSVRMALPRLFVQIAELAFPHSRRGAVQVLSEDGRVYDILKSHLPRVPADSSSPCGCGSGASYRSCCEPFHSGTVVERTAADVLRARFCAYKYRLVRYLIKSVSPSSLLAKQQTPRRWAAEIASFCDDYQFVELEVLETKVAGPRTTFIVFRANLLSSGEPVSFTENAQFVELNGRWYYDNGYLFDVDAGDAF